MVTLRLSRAIGAIRWNDETRNRRIPSPERPIVGPKRRMAQALYWPPRLAQSSAGGALVALDAQRVRRVVAGAGAEHHVRALAAAAIVARREIGRDHPTTLQGTVAIHRKSFQVLPVGIYKLSHTHFLVKSFWMCRTEIEEMCCI